MDPILYGIEKVNYLKRVVIALGGAPEEGQFQEAKKYFVRLRSSELDVKVVWMALGYILAKEAVEADND